MPTQEPERLNQGAGLFRKCSRHRWRWGATRHDEGAHPDEQVKAVQCGKHVRQTGSHRGTSLYQASGLAGKVVGAMGTGREPGVGTESQCGSQEPRKVPGSTRRVDTPARWLVRRVSDKTQMWARQGAGTRN